jgi:hypothetical protein
VNKPGGDYEVGYSKPPRETQFEKGQSGNPSGRPKGTKNVASVLARELRTKVIITESGRRKSVTKLEAAMKQLVNKAIQGDLAALRLLNAVAQSLDDKGTGNQPSDNSTIANEADRFIMQSVLKRYQESNAPEEKEKP